MTPTPDTMDKIGRFTVSIALSSAVAIALMFAFYWVCPMGIMDTGRLFLKWLIVWVAIVGYRHGMNAIDK